MLFLLNSKQNGILFSLLFLLEVYQAKAFPFSDTHKCEIHIFKRGCVSQFNLCISELIQYLPEDLTKSKVYIYIYIYYFCVCDLSYSANLIYFSKIYKYLYSCGPLGNLAPKTKLSSRQKQVG